MRRPRRLPSRETAIKADKFLLVVHGTTMEAARAKDILSTTRPGELNPVSLETPKPATV